MADNDLCVTRVPIFRGLTRAEQLRVAEFARPMQVSRGDTVQLPLAALLRAAGTIGLVGRRGIRILDADALEEAATPG